VIYDIWRQRRGLQLSKIKSPQEKKVHALKNDRRNAYGENSKASRKGIRRSKQRSHREERRVAGLVLNRLKETADENDAIEAEALMKTKILQKRRTAFKKVPDIPLGVVIKRKLASREKAESDAESIVHNYPNFHDETIFDVPYVRALHKRFIMFQLRYRTSVKGRRAHRTKTADMREFERKEAARWRAAILRDAPLLKGFFTQEPQWRDRMLQWCERILVS
jgi:hypothetical protein